MKRESKEWIKIAMENLQSAECLFTIPLYRMVCYHAQQAAEKILKATLTEDAIFLNSIYRARYPSDLGLLPSGEPTKEDADKALAIAKNTMNWFKDIEREH